MNIDPLPKINNWTSKAAAVFLSLLGLTLFASNSFAQNVTVDPGAGSYATLKDAFDAINTGTHTGAVTVTIINDTNETVSAVLNASGSGAASYNSIVINPSGARTVSGAISGHLIDLNGASNVTIDGLNTGGNSLTIDNTSSTTNTSTIRFRADTSTDIVTNCTIKGAGTSTTFGTVFFDTGSTSGNTGNTISNNIITNSGANFPANAIYSAGTSSVIFNSGTISGNNIQDYFRATSATCGINISATGNSGWSVTNNKLFQTVTRVYTAANTHRGIFIGSGSGYTITGNTVGFANAGGTGTTNLIGNTVALAGFPGSYTVTGTANATVYRGIECAFTAGGAASSIQNNTIAGIALYTSSGTTTSPGALGGIYVSSGSANIGTVTGNTIGATSGGGGASAASLYMVTTNTASGTVVAGITSANTAGDSIVIQNNTIGSVDSVGSTNSSAPPNTPISGGFNGIDAIASSGNFTITNNTIGNGDADNIRTGYTLDAGNLSNNGALTSTTGAGATAFIRCSTTGATANMSSNTLRGWATSSTVQTLTGIAVVGTSGNSNTTITINNNALGTAARGFARYAVANSGALFGIQSGNNVGAPIISTLNIQGNDFRGITYSVTGSGANTYIINTAQPPNTNIIGNTFTALNIASTGNVIFIQNNAHNAGTTHNVNNNTVVTSFTSSSTGAVAFYNAAGGSNTTVTETNNLNNFSNLTFPSGANILGWNQADGIVGQGSRKTITNNTFANITNGGATATTVLTVSQGDQNFGNNTVSGNVIDNVSGGGAVTGLTSAAGSQNFFSNTITSLSSSGASATVAGILVSGGLVQNVNNNTISGLSGSGATSPVANGISVGGGTTVKVYKNTICNIAENGAISTTAGAVNGLLISAGALVTAYDNSIGDLRAPSANLTDAIRGISVTSTTATTNYNVYYNTVHLAATSTGANFGTTGLFHAASTTASTATLDLRNNAIINKSIPNGTGLTVAYRRSAGAAGNLVNYSLNSNNNIFYAGAPSANQLIYSDGTGSAQTIAQYTGGNFTAGTIAPRDTFDATEDPVFLSVSCGAANFLRPDPSIASALESGGANVSGISDDIDGNIRQGNTGYAGTGTAPDIGASEIGGIYSDKVPPLISYLPLGSGASLTSRVFSNVTITDVSGVNGTSGTRPRVYYKKSSDANNTFNDNTNGTPGWKYAEANGATSPFDFTIDYSILFGGTASVGDTIQYFVVAQDSFGTPNVGSNSGFFASQPSSVALTGAAFPITGTIRAYTLVTATSYAGSYDVGVGQPFTTLTGAGGFFAAINAGIVTGNVTANIVTDITTEDGTNALNAWSEEGGSGFTITIQPSGAARAVSGTNAASALIKLNGANRVSINGSVGGAGTDRSLTITNNGATSPSVIWIGSVGNTPVINDTVKNCVLINGTNTSGAVVVSDAGTLGSSGWFNNITVQNNSVQKALRGIVVVGNPNGTNGSGTLITQNDLNTSGANSIRLNPISVQGINGVTISNNNMGNISDANAEVVIGVFLGSGTDNANVTGNNITNLTSSSTGTAGAEGIQANVGTNSTSLNVSNNTISSLTSAGGGLNTYGIGGFSPNMMIANNTITGLAMTGNANSFGIMLSGANNSTILGNTVSTMSSTANIPFGINVQGATTTVNISGNIVSGITSSSTTAGTAGIFLSGSIDNITVQNNKVTGISNTSPGLGGGAKGIRIGGTGNRHIVANNFVSDLSTNMTGGLNFSTTNGVHGIILEGGNTHKVYHNSVNLTGLLPGTPNSGVLTSAFTISNTNTNSNCDVRNNIFSNTITGGTTSVAHVATCIPSGGTTAFNLTWNNNALYTGTTAGVHGVCHVGTIFTSPPAAPPSYAGLYPTGSFLPGSTSGASNFRSYTSTLNASNTNNDSLSFASTLAAPFVSSTNLHVSTGLNPTSLESRGASVGVTSDMDNDVRPGPAGSVNGGALAPDIGADEFDGVPLFSGDIQAYAFVDPTNGGSKLAATSFSPQASFYNNGTTTQTNVTVRYRICTDSTCSTELYNNTQTIASIAPFTTTIATFASTSVPVGTYAIKAKAELAGDQAPANDEITGSFFAESQLNGAYTVGSGGNYPTFTQAISKLNLLGVSGPVVLNLTDANYGNESFPIIINSIPGASSTNTIKIKPASGVTASLTGASATAMVVFNGAKFVTIDGSNNGTSSRDLTITNTFIPPAGASAVIWLQTTSQADPATNNTIKNVNVVGSTLTATLGTLAGIGSGGTTIAINSLGTGNNNNTFQNNNITKCQYGIYSSGASAANKNTGTAITGNVMNAPSPNNLVTGGILVNFDNGAQISGNDISVLRHDGTTGQNQTAFGIALGVVPNNTVTTFTGSETTNAMVTGNRINGITQLSPSGNSAFGIVVNSAASGTTLIANNMISNVLAASAPNNFSAGIVAGGGTGSTTQVYFNSVSMTGSRNAATAPSYGLAINTGDPIVDVRNNILLNTQSSTSNGKMYAIATGGTTFANLTSNYNDFFVSGTNTFVGQTGSLGTAGTDRATLANWQTATGKDSPNSISANPLFTSTSNLHLSVTPLSPAINAGTAVGGITVDFDGDTRPIGPFNDIGADEVTNTVPTITAGSATRQQGSPASNSTIATVTDNETAAGSLTVTVTSANPSNGVTVSNIVNTAGTITADIVADCTATNASFTLQVSDGSLTSTGILNVTVTANTPPTLSYTDPSSIASGGSTTVNPATGPSDNGSVVTIVVQSQGTYTGTISVDNGTGVVSISDAAPAGTHTITIRATDNCGAFTDATFMLTVQAPTPTATATATATATSTPTATATFTPIPTPIPTPTPTPTPGFSVTVSLPVANVSTAVTNFTQPVTTTAISDTDNLIAFQGDFTFDSSVVTFQDPPISAAGLTGGNWNVTGNVYGAGTIKTLRVSAFSNDFTPLSGSGTLFQLNLTRVSSTPGANTPLVWAAPPDDFYFIDFDFNSKSPSSTPSGSLTIQVLTTVSLPIANVSTAVTNFTQPVSTTAISDTDNLVAFQGDFTFDSSIVTFQNPPVSASGLTGGNWNVTGNVYGAGTIKTLRVSAFSNDFTPLSGSGTLFQLNLTRVSSTPGATTPLIWAAPPDDFYFIDGDLNSISPTSTPSGSLTIQIATINISGTIVYCSNPSLDPVGGVTLNLTGDAIDSTTTNGSGNYTFTENSGGNYVVTPSMAPRIPGSAGIDTIDVIAVQLHYLDLATIPPGCRLTAADVNGDSDVDTVDVVAIQRFFLGSSTGIGNTGKYQFTPTNRTYNSVTTNQTGQGYDALVFGDVVSGFIHRPEGNGTDVTNGMNAANGTNGATATVGTVSLPNATVDSRENDFIAAVTTSVIDKNGRLIGFQGDFSFDERIVTFQDPPVEAAGLTAENWNVSGNVLPELTKGPLKTLRISAYSLDATPLSGSGTLFYLNMTRVSKTVPPTQLLWATPPDFFFIDTDLNTHKPGTTVPGSVRTK